MASFQIAPPEQFTSSQPEEWPQWIRQFERFRQASCRVVRERGLSANKYNDLLYGMGDAADDILTGLGLNDDKQKVYDTVKTRSRQSWNRIS